MNGRTRIALALVIAALAVAGSAAAAAQDDRPQDAYWFCYSSTEDSPMYVTPVWEAKAIPNDVKRAFAKMVGDKYDSTKPVTCSIALKAAPGNSLAKSQTDAKGMFAYWQKQGRKIVETGWTNSQAAAPEKWGLCRATVVAAGGSPNTGPFESYLSGAFNAGSASLPDLQTAFKTFLTSKYGLKDVSPSCVTIDTETNAASTLSLWTLDARRRGKVTETVWKFAR